MNLLADLTPSQAEAVQHIDGPLLVLAGPGSGKTRVITRRVAYMLQQGVRPWNILAITFTNKAAGEMRRRVLDLVPGSRVLICTFHSLGARLLRQYADRIGLDRGFTIYDQADRLQVVKEAMAAAQVDVHALTPDRVQGAISKAKNLLHGPAEYAGTADDFIAQSVARIYPIYEKRLRAVNALDFDDLLYWFGLMLRRVPEVRAELDERFRYVMIDEYQDTNFAQYVIARQLSLDYPNLAVVGDPDQSIYKFRGSDIRNILDFERDFPEAKVVRLEQNYRSTKNILRAADQLISFNRKRKPKTLATSNPDGTPIQIRTFYDGLAEAEALARHVAHLVRHEGRRYSDCAVFLRMNALSRTLEAAFIKHRVPYQIVRGLAFFDRKENKDMLAYLRLLVNPRDDVSFLRVVNEPARGIGKVSLEHLKEYAAPRDLSLLEAAHAVGSIPTIRGKAAKALADFARLLTRLRDHTDGPPQEVIKTVIHETGYRNMLIESKSDEDQDRLANIEELITAADQFSKEFQPSDGTDRPATLNDFLEHLTLKSDVDGWNEQNDQVSIMTLHAAKGLEFPVVFMPAFEQGILPHDRSRNSVDELEEERRLAFVGMTRAMQELHLSHAERREFRGMTIYTIPSPFLNELPEEGVRRHAKGQESFQDEDELRYVDEDDEDVFTRQFEAVQRRATPEPRPMPRPAEARPRQTPLPRPDIAPGTLDTDALVADAIVRHRDYGIGEVLFVTGSGDQKKVKIRFGKTDRTFVVAKAPLEVLGRK